jgi:NAD(P)-dependent dehydrogenase (short-subunit alcohol dehydrogenase family)
MNLLGASVLVTGGASGLGAPTAAHLCKAGASRSSCSTSTKQRASALANPEPALDLLPRHRTSRPPDLTTTGLGLKGPMAYSYMQ